MIEWDFVGGGNGVWGAAVGANKDFLFDQMDSTKRADAVTTTQDSRPAAALAHVTHTNVALEHIHQKTLKYSFLT